jgi:uncharacterized metal-binding protein YceD (DUF177 family)
MIDSLWLLPLKLSQVSALAPGKRLQRHLVADQSERAAVAKLLDIVSIDRLEADVDVAPWFDGAQIEGRWRADIVQICGVSLDPFPTALSGQFMMRVVPESSALVPQEALAEIVIEPDADDPPDVLESDEIDLAGYVVEHLSLEVDPFPRKPGAVFELPEQPRESSPFDVLRALKGGKADE